MNLVIWGLMTGAITGGVWIGILFTRRQQRIDLGRRGLDEMDARLRELEASEQRVAELEERLDFAERLLATQRDEAASRIAPK